MRTQYIYSLFKNGLPYMKDIDTNQASSELGIPPVQLRKMVSESLGATRKGTSTVIEFKDWKIRVGPRWIFDTDKPKYEIYDAEGNLLYRVDCLQHLAALAGLSEATALEEIAAMEIDPDRLYEDMYFIRYRRRA